MTYDRFLPTIPDAIIDELVADAKVKAQQYRHQADQIEAEMQNSFDGVFAQQFIHTAATASALAYASSPDHNPIPFHIVPIDGEHFMVRDPSIQTMWKEWIVPDAESGHNQDSSPGFALLGFGRQDHLSGIPLYKRSSTIHGCMNACIKEQEQAFTEAMHRMNDVRSRYDAAKTSEQYWDAIANVRTNMTKDDDDEAERAIPDLEEWLSSGEAENA